MFATLRCLTRCRAAGLHLSPQGSGAQAPGRRQRGYTVNGVVKPAGRVEKTRRAFWPASLLPSGQPEPSTTYPKQEPSDCPNRSNRTRPPKSDKRSPRRKRYSLHLITSRSLSLNEPKVTPPGSSCYYRAVQPPRVLCPRQPSCTNPTPSTSGYLSN